jgi:hypothetical protein
MRLERGLAWELLSQLLIHYPGPPASEQVSNDRLFETVVLPDQTLQHIVEVRGKACEKAHRREIVSANLRHLCKRLLQAKDFREIRQLRLRCGYPHEPHQRLTFACQPISDGAGVLKRTERRFVIQESIQPLDEIKLSFAPCKRRHFTEIDGLTLRSQLIDRRL